MLIENIFVWRVVTHPIFYEGGYMFNHQWRVVRTLVHIRWVCIDLGWNILSSRSSIISRKSTCLILVVIFYFKIQTFQFSMNHFTYAVNFYFVEFLTIIRPSSLYKSILSTPPDALKLYKINKPTRSKASAESKDPMEMLK